MKTNFEREITRRFLWGWAVISVVLSLAYALEVVKGERGYAYLLVFLGFAFVPYFIVLIYSRFNPPVSVLKWIIVSGYIILYTFVMITGSTQLVFVYIFPMLSLAILYRDPNMIVVMGAFSIVDNMIYFLRSYMSGEVTLENSKDFEIQLFMTILTFIYSYVASELYARIANQNEENIREVERKTDEQREIVMQTITAIANTIDAKDEYTQGHSYRVAQYSKLLAEDLGKSPEEVDRIYYIALLHDIGKIGIPDSVLHKPGRLTREEYALIKQHPTIGANILKDIKSFPGLEIGAQYHHERFDGTGYPYGKSGDEIPEIARIVGVADTFDAMNSNRVYRKHFSQDYIVNELESGKGSQFDPVIADSMIRLVKNGRIDELTEEDIKHEETPSTREAEALLNANRLLLNSLAGEHSERYLLEALSNEETVRRITNDIAEELMSPEKGGMIMLINVDDISKINRELGYLKGDFLLATIAEALVNDDELIVCRMEGDEFLAYRSGKVTEDEAIRILADLRQNVKMNLAKKDEFMQVTFSIGAAISDKDNRNFHKLLTGAEKALYHVKQNRKDSYYIYASNRSDESRAVDKDLDAITAVIEHREAEEESSATNIDYNEFSKIYELMRNIGIKNAQSVRLCLFTLVPYEDREIHLSDRQDAIGLLTSAIGRTVRKTDITARYSSLQQLVLFLNLDENEMKEMIAQILKEFYNMSPDIQFQVNYACRDVVLDGQEINEN